MRVPVLRSILVTTDLSEVGGRALAAAGGIAQRTGAALHVLHALDIPAMPYEAAHTPAGGFHEQVAAGEAALARQLAEALPAGVEAASREVVIYTAHRAILEHAALVAADLIVLGPHRPHPTADRWLGTTADRVLHGADVPCLVVRAPLRLPLARVVAPTDLSERGGGVLDAALRWAVALGAGGDEVGIPGVELRVIHVIPRVFESPDFPFDRAVIGPEMSREVEAALVRTGAAASVQLREEVLWGDRPDESIVRYVEQHGGDLLVIGTHGHGAIRRRVLGSVASGVARAAPVPVLLLPPAAWRAAGGGAI